MFSSLLVSSLPELITAFPQLLQNFTSGIKGFPQFVQNAPFCEVAGFVGRSLVLDDGVEFFGGSGGPGGPLDGVVEDLVGGGLAKAGLGPGGGAGCVLSSLDLV